MTSKYAYEVETQIPSITDDSLAEARKLIGVELRRKDHRWNSEANIDSIGQYCKGIGEINPLFTDPEYAAKTKYGRIIAPPTFLYSVDTTIVAPGLRGVQWIGVGFRWQFFRPILCGDRFTVSSKLIDAVEKKGQFAKRFIIQTGELIFRNQNAETVAICHSDISRIPRAKAKGGGLSYEARETHRYSAQELAKIEALILNEEIRGAEPRYWEDVKVGDSLGTVARGPLTITDMILWYAGGGTHYKAHGIATRHRVKHPADAYKDPVTGVQDEPARGHEETYMAREVGMPGIYDIASQRVSWMDNLVTNWMGDDGFVRTLNIQIRRPNILGDTTFCRGTVREKTETDGQKIVAIDLLAENQLGEVTAKGDTTVVLPTRA